MSKRHILVIEDDPAIRRGLADALDFDGYEVIEAPDAPTGLEMGLRRRCDLILLDLMLPGGDGFDLLGELRAQARSVPVIILTARGREADRVRGLRMGADDYVVKPFSIQELLARIAAVLRRSGDRAAVFDRYRIPEGVLDLGRRELRFDDGERGEISPREVDLLTFLAEHAGRAVGREELLRGVWRVNPSAHARSRTVDMTVARLREKLRDAKDAPRVLLTVRGKGYMLGEAARPLREEPEEG